MVIGLSVLFANVILQDQSHKLAIGWQGSANADRDLKVASVKSARKASMVIPTQDASLAIVVLMDQDLPIAIYRLVNVIACHILLENIVNLKVQVLETI